MDKEAREALTNSNELHIFGGRDILLWSIPHLFEFQKLAAQNLYAVVDDNTPPPAS